MIWPTSNGSPFTNFHLKFMRLAKLEARMRGPTIRITKAEPISFSVGADGSASLAFRVVDTDPPAAYRFAWTGMIGPTKAWRPRLRTPRRGRRP